MKLNSLENGKDKRGIIAKMKMKKYFQTHQERFKVLTKNLHQFRPHLPSYLNPFHPMKGFNITKDFQQTLSIKRLINRVKRFAPNIGELFTESIKSVWNKDGVKINGDHNGKMNGGFNESSPNKSKIDEEDNSNSKSDSKDSKKIEIEEDPKKDPSES